MSRLSLIVTTYNHKKAQVDLIINSLLCQSSNDWTLYMVHDGPNPECREWVEDFQDHRVKYRESATRTGFWGHYNRRWLLDEVNTKWVTWGNADNYYCPPYVEWLTDFGDRDNLDVVLTNVAHNYANVNGRNDPQYSVLEAGFGINRVDFISFIIRTELVRKVGINHPEFTGCDGMIIEDLKAWSVANNYTPRWQVAPHVLAVHN